MDSDYDIFEIVTVIRDFWLVDAESYQRRYFTNHGQPLAAGYYVVNWPEHIRARRFNHHASFHGPFKMRKEAKAFFDWLHAERASLLSMSTVKAAAATPDPNPIEAKNVEAKKAGLHKLRPAESLKGKQNVFDWKPGGKEVSTFRKPEKRFSGYK